MKKALSAILCALLLTGCGNASGSSSTEDTMTWSDSVSQTASESEPESVNDSTEESTTESTQNEDSSNTELTYDPYELEKSMSDGDYFVDDSEKFEKIEDMRNSVWGDFLSERGGVPKEKLTPKPKEGFVEYGCTAHLSFYRLSYDYKDKPYNMEVYLLKFDNIEDMYEKFFKEMGFMMPNSSTEIKDGLIIDKNSEYTNGYALMGLSSEGLAWSLYANDKGMTLDEMKEFASQMEF